MQRILYLAIFVAIASSYTVSIGACAQYALSGSECQKCIENFHLFNGVCYSDIQNCIDYKSGISCQKCSNSTILINNSCLDIQSLQKMLISQNGQTQQFSVETNLNKIIKLVDFVENGFLKGNGGNLIKFEVTQYDQVWRWFLLYQFGGQFTSYQRMIVDENLKTETFTAVDFSSLRNPDDFSTMFWRDVDNTVGVLATFANLYPTSANYLQVIAKKAILSEVTQFEIVTVSKDKVEIREICSFTDGIVVLSEYVQTFSLNSTAQPSSSVESVFNPFQLTFRGIEIDAEMDVNDGLASAVNLVKNSSSWNHTLTQVTESGKSSNLTEFTIVGQNSNTTLNAVVDYNPVNGSVLIVKLTLEASTQPFNSTSSTTSTQSSAGQKFNRIHIEREGCTTHTWYSAPLDKDIEDMADKLLKIRGKALLAGVTIDPSTPFIQAPNLIFRRLVTTSFCEGYNYREVAYVEGDNATTKEYYTYYLEEDETGYNGTKTWYLLGNNSKVQTTDVYDYPQNYAINFVDPSFVNPPFANLYTQKGVASTYLNNLSDDDRILFMGLTKNMSSEMDRNLGKMSRYSLDAKDSYNASSTYRATGWNVLAPPPMFTGFSPYMSLLCPGIMITETLILGSSGPSESSSSQSSNNGNNLIRNEP